MSATDFMQALWLEMRDGAGPEAQFKAAGAIELARVVGLFSDDIAELWLRRVRHSCPGHDDEGGRDWCAYCGEMNRDAPRGDTGEGEP